MTPQYAEKLEAGLEFQDFVMSELHSRGIVLQPIASKRGQLKGENLLGLEIKFDRKLAETGNLYIETYEKSNPANPCFVCSGILRNDNTWLYGIGNHSRLWIFAKSQLRLAYQHLVENKRKWEGVRFVENETSKGFLVPAVLANHWAARVIDFSKGVAV